MSKPPCWVTTRGVVVLYNDLRKLLGDDKYKAFIGRLTILLPQKIGPVVTVRAFAYVDVDNVGEFVGDGSVNNNNVGNNNNISATKLIILPRSLLPALSHLFTVHLRYPELRIANIELTGELFENQQIIINYLLETIFTEDKIKSGLATGIINVRAGFGKSFIIGGLVSRLKLRTLIILPKKPLAIQMVDDLQKFLKCKILHYKNPTKDNKVNKVKPVKPKKPRTTKKPKQQYDPLNPPDIAVVVINTALTMPVEYITQFSFVAMDECHTLCSKQRQEIFRRANLPLMLGLSATTSDRMDKKDPVVHKQMVIGDIIYAENIPGFKYSDDTKFEGTVRVINYRGPPEYTKVLMLNNMMNTKLMLDQFVNDPHRMQLCVRELKQMIDEGHYIYVFCAEKAPLVKLFELLQPLFPVDAPEITGVKKFNGDVKADQIQDIKNTARVLLSTYGYAGTGVSIMRFTAIMFFSSQKAQMKQIVARILRRGSDPQIVRKICDIVDYNTPIKSQHRYRKLAYQHYGFDVKKIDISWDEIC